MNNLCTTGTLYQTILSFKQNAACITIAIIYAQQVHYIKPYFLIVLQHQPIETVRSPVSRSSSSGFRGPGLSRERLPAGYAASLQAF